MSQSSSLYRLQQVDSQLDLSHNRIHEIDNILNQDTELIEAQQLLDTANHNLADEKKILRHAEQAVEDIKVKIEQTEAMLYSGKVRNPKELQDLQNESAALKRHLTLLEDRELEAMLAVETAEQQVDSSTQNLQSIITKRDSQFSLLNGEKHNLDERINRLETERQAAVNTLASENLLIYDQLRKQRRGVAVAKVVDKSCSACGSALTAALIQRASSTESLVRCSTCGRIIYPG
jgi:hypothetical protein